VNEVMGRRVRLFKVLCVATVALSCGALAASAGAAPVTPNSATDCLGSISKDRAPTPDDPNLIDYSIYCHGDFTAYTLIAHRRVFDFDTIDGTKFVRLCFAGDRDDIARGVDLFGNWLAKQ